MEQENEVASAFKRLYDIIKILRSPNGCPWDKEQTPLSMRADLIEETFEAVDAINTGDALHIAEELGDVLLNTVMICYMEEQAGNGSVASTIQDLCDKLILRHPHVFKDSKGQVVVEEKATTAEQVLTQWDKIKDKVEKREMPLTLDCVPQGLPPLMKAYKYQKKASKKGFDWDNVEGAFDKMQEEIAELKEAISKGDMQQVEEEAGDLIFTAINIARLSNTDANVALSLSNNKFKRRFDKMETQMKKQGLPMTKENRFQMEEIYQAQKKCE